VTDKLKDGSFYWVRPAPGADWEPAHFMDGAFWLFGNAEQAPVAEVGPELVPPDRD
jgi:hypothetical protein